MKNIQFFSDKLAISLSVLCTIHCLALPLLVVFLPSVIALPLEGEAFHLWMAIIVIPISVYALTMGCKQHNRKRVLFTGGLGLLILISAVLFGHDFLGEVWEKTLTVVGASIIALGHVWNYRLCQMHENCGCSDHSDTTEVEK